MATDMTLKITGIEGESQKDGHTNEIDVLSFSFGATQSGTAHVGFGSGGGQANVQDLTVTKYVDKASPLLFFNCVTGAHIEQAVLSIRRAGGKPLDYMVVTLKQVVVTSVSTGASGTDDRVQETISLNFSEITHQYTPQNKDGSGLGPIIKKYSVSQGKEM
jgi:type VI secretion system secreted protein Hcp